MTGRRAGLRSRLLVAHLLVVLAGSVALAVVAVLVAPGTFRGHLEQAGDTDPTVRSHAQQAFDSAFGISLGVGTLVAVVTAAVVSAVIVRRLGAPVSQLADAADALAAGSYDTKVPDARLGPEFDRLTVAFTDMAARLARTEAIRRRLMADLAHEMRTPVSTLAAHVDGLEDGVVASEPAIWQVLRGQLERLDRLATDLGQLSAAQEHSLSMHPRPADLGEIARTAVDAAAPAYRSKAVTLTLLNRNPLTVVVDAVRIQQVLAGLLDNALRHTPMQGSVTVEVDGVVVTVTDTGTGIAADELDAVFDRFHRVDGARSRADGGSGLGLTIARAITAAHGGTVTVRSAGLGAGSTFVLRLPVTSR